MRGQKEIAQPKKKERQAGPDDALDHPLNHERRSDEPRSGAYQLHNLNLVLAGEDRQFHRAANDHKRGDEKEPAEDPFGPLYAEHQQA